MSRSALMHKAQALLQREFPHSTSPHSTRQKSHPGDREHVVFAPGRVNLIGEHTDYNDGLVLPCALPLGTAIAVSPRDDGELHAVSGSGSTLRRERFSLQPVPAPLERGSWANYLRGMVAEMSAAGIDVPGANLAIVGDLPQGAGLSSSASLSVAIARALLALSPGAASNPPSNASIARWAQSSEHRYAGCLCGIMDPMAAACVAPGEALLLDCQDLTARTLAIPADWTVLIIDSGARRELVSGEYNARRAQCEAAAVHYGVRSLRELDSVTLNAARAALDDTTFRRARHVVHENDRVRRAAEALAQHDLKMFGAALRDSHRSLHEDFEVTIPQTNELAEQTNRLIDRHAHGQGGARMTGGGFGGCIVAVLESAASARIVTALYRSGVNNIWTVSAESERPESSAPEADRR